MAPAPGGMHHLKRIMFAVDDIEDVVARLRTHGADLVGEPAPYEDEKRTSCPTSRGSHSSATRRTVRRGHRERAGGDWAFGAVVSASP
ncbi:hypothetical protein [Streptomyces sp900116325]|uniref:hypothetical protein n=1 Tax=Streptomyces sp. 900116325 TaxID=3154295 RepID=UPI0033ABB278